MSAFVFNIAKGRVAELARLTGANDAFVAVLLRTGCESEATLQDYDSLSALLAGAGNVEASFTGYSRKTLAGVAATVDDSGNRVDVDATDPDWNPTSSEALAKILICYDADTTSGTDADIIPLVGDDFVVTTPDTGLLSYQIASGGFYRAS